MKISTDYFLRNFLWIVIILIPLVGSQKILNAANYTHTIIAVPGATHTTVTGINNSGQIVGSYFSSSTGSHAFLGEPNQDGIFTFTTVDFPGATGTVPQGINNLGQIVGFYNDSSSHGFIREPNGTFNTFNYPGTTSGTILYDINDLGDIVGFGGSHGFVRLLNADGTFTYITIPIPLNATFTSPRGINNSRQIVAEFGDGVLGGNHGFFIWDLIKNPVPLPIEANGINNLGQVVGGRSRWDPDGNITQLDSLPPAGFATAQDINDLGQIVGWFDLTTGGRHGFLAVPAKVEFVGVSDRLKLDSGFDGTNVAKTIGSLARDLPAIVSVAVGQTTTVARAVIPPPLQPNGIKFRSKDLFITVSPEVATASPQILTITGITLPPPGLGFGTIEAYNDQGTLGTLNIAVLPKKTIKAGVSIVQLAGCAPPIIGLNKNFTAKTLKDSVNKILDQAGVQLDVVKTIKSFVGKKAINVGTPRQDCFVDPSMDLVTIDREAREKNVDVNIYLVTGIYYPPPLDVLRETVGLSARYTYLRIPAILIQATEDQVVSNPVFPPKATERVVAHELGHDQGLPHCDDANSIDNQCAGNPNDKLMYSGGTGATLDAPEWGCFYINVADKPCVLEQ